MCRSGTDSCSAHSRAGGNPVVQLSPGRLIAAALAVAALGTALGGCSQIYFDRREGVTVGAGDAIAANEALQTIDPWPARSANPNLAFNGQRMQSAVERYRTNNVTQPVDPQQIESSNQLPATIQITPPPSGPAPSIGAGSTSTTTNVITAPPQQASQ